MKLLSSTLFLFVSLHVTLYNAFKPIISNRLHPSIKHTYDLSNHVYVVHRYSKTYLYSSSTSSSQILSDETKLLSTYTAAFITLPVVSYFIIPLLLNSITDVDVPTEQRQIFIISLLLSKRIFLYSLACSAVQLSAWRSVYTSSQTQTQGLGQRLQIVNEELFQGTGLMIGENNRAQEVERLQTLANGKLESLRSSTDRSDILRLQQELDVLGNRTRQIEETSNANRIAYDALDTVGGKELSLLLPVLLATSLLISFFFISSPSLHSSPELVSPIVETIQRIGSFAFKVLTSLSIILVSFLFTKVEILNYVKLSSKNMSNERKEKLAFGISLLLVMIAYIHIPFFDIAWPVQNIINVCVAVTVSRVLQIQELKWVCCALIGKYIGFSKFLSFHNLLFSFYILSFSISLSFLLFLSLSFFFSFPSLSHLLIMYPLHLYYHIFLRLNFFLTLQEFLSMIS